jgi:hypothetical protein
MRGAAGGPALDAQAARRSERADRKRRRGHMAVAVPTALCDRNRAARDYKGALAEALRVVTEDEGLPVPQGRRRQRGTGITVREVTGLRAVADQPPVGASR